MGLNIPPGSRIAFDTPVLIYFLEHHPRFYQEVQQLFERMERGDIRGVLSSLALTELLVPAFRVGQADKAQDLLSLLSGFPNLDTLDVTTPIAVTAARLRGEHKLNIPDALHAATALHAKANALVTNDRDFLRLESAGLRIALLE